MAAALGDHFPDKLLVAVSPLDEPTLKIHLDALLQAEILRVRHVAGQKMYAFTHPLIKECAYTSLARSRRRQIHASIAATLETQLPEMLEQEPALLVRHLEAAGLREKARRVRETRRF